MIPPSYEWAIKHMRKSKKEQLSSPSSSSSSKDEKTTESTIHGCFKV
ncbi:unnamed protein product [Anisakis simplex]|uniref:Uncharacterized protein n=1 Tax=Anisakis simplex TaxID=6269 RepID=A0A3P6Q5U8_ANISI|nr:unnamed protein product [Anisakis simplex]